MITFGRLAGCALVAALSVAPASASTCPSAVVFQSDATGSRVDAGWTGLAHDMPVNGYAFRMDLSCAAGSPPCGTCSITGLAPNAGGNNQRCLNDTSVLCTVATEVADCGGAGLCRFFAGAPTAMAAGGVSSCYTTEITGAVSGSVDVDTGDLSPDVPLKVSLYSGLGQDNPCPRCLGDAAQNDNVRGGTCDAGPRAGLPCDANATAEYPDFGASSFDCPPNPFSKIADFVLGTIPFSTATQSLTLSAASPTCKGYPGSRCFCDTCNSLNAQACQSNADCVDPLGPIGPICGGKRCVGGTNAGAACVTNTECPSGGLCGVPGEPSKPSGCLDDTNTVGLDCTDTAPVDGEGECLTGPVSKTCTIASGHPQRGCSIDADCGGMLGSCLLENRKCYPDLGLVGGSLAVSGVATPPAGNTSDPTDLSALTCLRPTSSGAVNSVGGFPGVVRGSYPGRAIFAEEIVVEVTPPGGTVTTSGSGPASVVETTVTTPIGGEVQIIGTFNAGAAPSGYEFLGRLVQITAKPATVASPLRISFDIDASEIPSGQDETTIEIFRNGVGPIPNCLGATQAIPNDPCITARTPLGGGDVRITALTSAASAWTMAVPVVVAVCPPAVDPGCRSPFVGGKAQVLLVDKTPDTKDQVQWKWLAGQATTVGEFGDPLGSDDYALCIYNALGLAAEMRAPAGGTCAGKPCWSAKPTGFRYKDKDLTPSGIAQITLKAGVDGKAQIQVKGKGDNLAMPLISSTMVVQLRNATSGQCWTATYSSPFDKFDGITLKGKAD